MHWQHFMQQALTTASLSDGPEFPILDGSAKQYVECIQRVGIEEQNAVKDYYIIKSKIEFRDEASGSSILFCR